MKGKVRSRSNVSRDQHREAALAWWQRFPDLVETTQEMMVEEVGRLFLRTVSTGTLKTSWSGIEPTGRKVEWGAWYAHRIEDGLIVEEIIGSRPASRAS